MELSLQNAPDPDAIHFFPNCLNSNKLMGFMSQFAKRFKHQFSVGNIIWNIAISSKTSISNSSITVTEQFFESRISILVPREGKGHTIIYIQGWGMEVWVWQPTQLNCNKTHRNVSKCYCYVTICKYRLTGKWWILQWLGRASNRWSGHDLFAFVVVAMSIYIQQMFIIIIIIRRLIPLSPAPISHNTEFPILTHDYTIQYIRVRGDSWIIPITLLT